MPDPAQRYRRRTRVGRRRLRRLAADRVGRDGGPARAAPDGESERLLDELIEGGDVEPSELSAAANREAAVSEEAAYGRIGPALDRRSPFWIGMSATFGVAVAGFLLLTIYYARGILLVLGLSLFIAAGLDPVVEWLHRWMRRPFAVLIVIVAGLALAAGFGDLVVPVLVHQVTHLANALPRYFTELKSSHSFVGRLNRHYHLQTAVKHALAQRSSSLASGLLGIGKAVLGTVASGLVVAVVSIYLLFDLPRFKRLVYGLAPRSRRARTVLLGDQIFAKVGGYVLGNVVISIVSGIGTYIWCVALGVPFPLLLAVLVAVLDLVPVVGSTVGGVVVALVALTVSVPVALATAVFYLAYRLIEDYLLSPRIMRRTVDVPGLVTVVATLLGGVLLGVVGALIAIPVAAAVKLLLEELAAPRLEQS